MILFVCKYPDISELKEGMMQRVKTIDNRFVDYKRIYLDISNKFILWPKICSLDDNLKKIKVNIILHLPFIIVLAIKAKHIYFHSIYNSIRFLPAYYLKKPITDMHGLVPEELRIQGNKIKSYVYSVVENVVTRRSSALLTVSQVMRAHLIKKYGNITAEFINLPIFDQLESLLPDKLYTGKLTVIYSGGMQKWQNVEKMLLAIKMTQNIHKYQIFSGERELFMQKIKEESIESSILVKSLGKNELIEYYKQAHLGFLLRDDICVNNVACPTKLVEYMSYGVIPIVLQAEIGDFNKMNYSYILYSDFICGRIPDTHMLLQMSINNHIIIKQLINNVIQSEKRLKDIMV